MTVRPLVRLVVPERVERGTRAALRVQVVPAHPGTSVTLEKWKGGAWTEWRSLTLGDELRAWPPGGPTGSGLAARS